LNKNIAICWFRQDLRLSDNPALSAASNHENLLPIYILDKDNSGENYLGAASKFWLHHSLEALKKSFGGKVVIKMKDGSIFEEERDVADAHPSGLRPFRRANYIEKFKELTDGIISKSETDKADVLLD